MSDSSPDKNEPQPRSSDTPTASGDTIIVGDLTRTVAAIGQGAQVIYKQALSAADEAREQKELERQTLAQAVAGLADSLSKLASKPPSESGNPYKDLLNYELSDAARFFGRDAAVDGLLDDMICGDARCRFAVLHGDSGIGKTSLLQAGIAPALVAAQHLPLYVRVTSTSASVLVRQIKQTLLPDLNQTPDLKKAPLRAFLRRVAGLLPEGKRVFVILDQFETFFEVSQETRQQFIDELAACLFDDDPRDHWLLSVRSPMLGHLNTFQPTIPQPFANVTVLPPLSRDDARKAVVEPGKLRDLTLEDNLLDALLDDLGGDAVDPSGLQLVSHTLFEGLSKGGKRLTLDAYTEIGRAEGVLHDYLDRVLERNLPSADRELAWQTLSAIAEVRPRSATEAGLIEYLGGYDISGTDTQRALRLLESNRLIRLSDEHYHLTSDSLLPRIREWAAERAALEQARAETIRQVERVRGSALRGLLGGALGFSLAFLVTFGPQTVDKALLGYITAYRALPGAIAGLLLVLFVDVALASYHGPRRWMRWLTGGLAGALSFALAVWFHAVLRLADPADMLGAIGEGALWGLVTGLGTIWVMNEDHPLWRIVLQTLAVALVAGGVLSLADSGLIGNAFGDPPSDLLVGLAGVVMPLFVMGAALLSKSDRSTN